MSIQQLGLDHPIATTPIAHPLVPFNPLPASCGRCTDVSVIPYSQAIFSHPLPLRQALLSEYFPSDADKDSAKLALCCLTHQAYQIRARWDFLAHPQFLVDDDIIRARQRCEEARMAIKDSWRAHQRILVPIRNVPDDIISVILQECVEQTDTRVSPLLSLVCRRWRRVACCTPGLWSNIAIVLNLHQISSFRNAANFLECCVSRSGVLALRFKLDVDFLVKGASGTPSPWLERLESLSEHPHAQSFFWPFVDALIASALRWQEATIISSPSFLRMIGRAVWTGRYWELPILRRLSLDVQIQSTEDYACFPSALFVKAPMLRHINFLELEVDFEQVLLLPWVQLASWSFAAPTTVDLKKLLRKCPNLVCCENANATSNVQQDVESLRHNLQILDLHASGEGAFELFLKNCELPSLVELSLHSDPDLSSFWSQRLFERFLMQSLCTLRKLVLDIEGLTTRDLLAICGLIPSLLELHIIDRPTQDFRVSSLIDTVLMERLTLPTSQSHTLTYPVLLPNLGELRLTGRLSFDLRAFIAMAKSRTEIDHYHHGFTGLRSLVLNPSGPLDGFYSHGQVWLDTGNFYWVEQSLKDRLNFQIV